MRQRRKLVFPVFLLALLAQIFAPFASSLAMRADAPAGTPHCSIKADGAASAHQTPPGQHSHCDHQCCLLCHLPQAVEPAPMAVAVAAPAPAARDVVWTFSPVLRLPLRAAKHARARAPPSFS
ncbi:MAG: DUF2946 family protein [Methylocella sp.]